MNNELMFSSKTDLWSTPQDFFDRLNKVFLFQVDVCSNVDNAKCKKFFTEQDDGLKQEWIGVCWMNPHTAEKLAHGLQKLTPAQRKTGQQLCACCRHEQTHGGGMTTAKTPKSTS